jgi:hypothetical protein
MNIHLKTFVALLLAGSTLAVAGPAHDNRKTELFKRGAGHAEYGAPVSPSAPAMVPSLGD